MRDLLERALELPQEERGPYLDALDSADPTIREEVESLLRSHERADGFLDQPVARIQSPSTEERQRGSDELDPPLPERLGPYRILGRIGRGGMGAVYHGVRDDDFRREVAVKVLLRGLDTEELVARFRSERQILANLDHPYIAKLLDGGSTPEGLPFLVMEKVDGAPIDQVIVRDDLGVPERLRLFIKVCDAVQFAHQNLVIHRDLKPANVLVNEGGEPKLLDFGVAKLLETGASSHTVLATGAGRAPMTPQYASPEQLQGRQLTTASDVYSLGLMLFELLTGRRPYELAPLDPRERERVVCETPPPRPSTVAGQAATVRLGPDPTTTPTEGDASPEAGSEAGPASSPAPSPSERRQLQKQLAGDLDNIVLTALRKEPGRRYNSAGALARDLERHLEGRPVSARPDTVVYRLSKFVGRHRAGVAAAASALLVLLGLLTTLLIQRQQILGEYAKTQALNRAIVGMFTSIDPKQAQGEEVTLREVVDEAAGSLQAELRGQPELLADLLPTLGDIYSALGRYDRAEPFLIEALELRTQLYGAGDTRVAETLEDLGWLRVRRDESPEAIEMMRQALARLETRHGAESETVIEARARLGSGLASLDRFTEAEEQLQTALATSRSLLGNEHLTVAINLRRLAVVHTRTGRYREAEALLREALAILGQAAGERHPETARTLVHLATLMKRDGRYEEAETLHRRSIEAVRRIHGQSAPLAAAINALGSLLLETGRLDEAEEAYREALDMRRRVLQPDHSRVAESLNNLGSVLDQAGRLDEAQTLHEQALDMRRRRLGDQHLDVAGSLNNLAGLRKKRRRFEDAGALYGEAIAIYRANGAEGDPNLVRALSNLANLRELQQRPDEAAELYREAIELGERAGIENPWSRGAPLLNLARLLIRQERNDEAEPLLAAAEDNILNTLGEDATLLAEVDYSTARLKLARGLHAEGESHARRAASIWSRRPAARLKALSAIIYLGEALTGLGRFGEAAEILSPAYEELRDSRGADDPYTAAAARRLRELCAVAPTIQTACDLVAS